MRPAHDPVSDTDHHPRPVPRRGLIRRIPKALLLLVLLFPPLSRAQPPEVWLNHYRLGDFAQATAADWQELKPGITAAIFYLHTLWEGVSPPEYYHSPDRLRGAISGLRQHGTLIAIEGGYFDWKPYHAIPGDRNSRIRAQLPFRDTFPGIGAETAATEIREMANLIDLGEKPDFILLDGPMRRLTLPGQDQTGSVAAGLSKAEAAREVVSYLRAMRQEFPEMKFIVIVNFPNWGWRGRAAYHQTPGGGSPMNWGDAHEALDVLFAELSRHDLKLHALQADFPWRYYHGKPRDPVSATVDWRKRLAELAQYARRKDTRFHLVFNSETGYSSAEDFAEDSLRYLDAFLADGGRPDAAIVQSWYPHPKEVLPVARPHTSGWLAARFLERLHALETGELPVDAPPAVANPFDRSEPAALCHLLHFLDPEAAPALISRTNREWLDLPRDPPAKQAAGILHTLRQRAKETSDGLPQWSLVLKKDGRCKLKAADPPQLGPKPGKVLLEVINLTEESQQVTIWSDGREDSAMKPVWIAPANSRLLAADLANAGLNSGTVALKFGMPESDRPPAILHISKSHPLPISRPPSQKSRPSHESATYSPHPLSRRSLALALFETSRS